MMARVLAWMWSVDFASIALFSFGVGIFCPVWFWNIDIPWPVLAVGMAAKMSAVALWAFRPDGGW